jgi:acyl-CoA hydrolase
VKIGVEEKRKILEEMKEKYPEKFAPEEKIFGQINRGDRIFIGTGCGEPQYLVHALVNYVEKHPKAFFDAEVLHVWTMGVAPYANETYQSNFRQNSFFIGNDTVREAINKGIADFTPIFLSQVPRLFYRKMVPIDVALIQTSAPDHHGYMSLGVSVDITKAATENATLVIVQVNAHMPRVHGDTFIHLDEVDFIIPHDEPLLEYESQVPDEVAQNIGKYVSQLIEDGDTIQVGYGSLPNAILSNLGSKKHLGVHTELLTDGIVELMKAGVIDNSQKDIHRGKSVATFCMGKTQTYDAIHDHPGIEFRSIDYTNDPLVIARNKRMTAINSALQIDLTGQATAESIGWRLYSGIGGQADFMRGAVLSPEGKTILTLQSTAEDGKISRIVPSLDVGAGVSLMRGDVHYVITEWGIAYLHGKNIRERAMDLIAIAHPKFRPWLIVEAKRLDMI